MQYTDGTGIQATKLELSALLKFCGADRFDMVSIKLEAGHLLAWATNGISALYHHGVTLNGSGKPSKADDSWQIPGDQLRTIVKAAASGDEVIFAITKSRQLASATLRDIKTSTEHGKLDLSNVGTTGELFDIRTIVPPRPERDGAAVTNLMVAPSLLAALRSVSKATAADACRVWMPSSWRKPIYVELDSVTSLSDSEQPHWVAVLMPLSEGDEGEGPAVDSGLPEDLNNVF